ncbi:MAG: FAD-dependent oxidoreductase, partial [Alphaproteobacteria bacterium]
MPGLELKSRWVHWGDRISAVNREALVDRYAFDHAILDEATAKGVNVVKGRVTNLSRGETGWQVTYRTPDGGRHWITGTFVVEARGRAAPLGG